MLALLTVAAVLVVLVELPTSPRPLATLAVTLLLGTAAALGYGVVRDRHRAWSYGHVLVMLGLGLLLATVGGPTLGATLLLVVVVVQAVLLLPLPAAAAVVAVVPLVHLGMSWQDGWRAALGTLVTAVFAAVVTLLAVREQQARDRSERTTAELRRLGARVAGLATEAERLRVARDIHDGLGHHLTVVQVQVRAARAVLTADPDRADALLASAQEQAGHALAEVRRSVRALRGPLLDIPLPDAIARLVEESAAVGPPAVLQVIGTPRPPADDVDEVLFRGVQEGLTNVRRHARAHRVDVELDYTDASAVQLRVRDDGSGPGEALSEGAGVGLVGLRERVDGHGGVVELRAVDGDGSLLEVRVPT